MYVCLYVCMYVCLVCIYVCMYVCAHVHICMHIYFYISIVVYLYRYIHMFIWKFLFATQAKVCRCVLFATKQLFGGWLSSLTSGVFIYIYIYKYIVFLLFIFTTIFIFIFISIRTHTHIYIYIFINIYTHMLKGWPLAIKWTSRIRQPHQGRTERWACRTTFDAPLALVHPTFGSPNSTFDHTSATNHE